MHASRNICRDMCFANFLEFYCCRQHCNSQYVILKHREANALFPNDSQVFLGIINGSCSAMSYGRGPRAQAQLVEKVRFYVTHVLGAPVVYL